MLHKLKAAKEVKLPKPVKPQLSEAEQKVLKNLLGQDPHYEELLLKDLKVEWEYQDRPREKLIDQIATYFSPAMLGIFQVSRRPDGSLWVCDGTTRKLGMEQGGKADARVRCQVHNTEGVKQEALLFKHYNAARKAVPLANRLTADGMAGIDKGFVK